MNSDLLARYKSALPSFLNPYYHAPVEIVRGEGSWVFDSDNNAFLDFFGGVLTTSIGHNNPAVTKALVDQASQTLHTSTLYLSEPMIALAERIKELSGIKNARVFFTPSGTEANDAALLLATSTRRSNQIFALRNSYHGRSASTQAITAQSTWGATSYSGLKVTFMQGPYKLRSPHQQLNDHDYIVACTDDLIQLLDMTVAGDVAAMIAEPIQGVGGFATPPDGFFTAIKTELDRRGILFISDEVQTGWGRTGQHFWGYQAHDIQPDMLTFAKGAGNGVSLAGVVARADLFDTIDVLHFSTFGGNPLCAAAGLATIDYIVDNDLQDNAKTMGKNLRDGLEELAQETPWIAEVRGKGLMQAIEIVEPASLKPSKKRTSLFHEICKDYGLLLGTGGMYNNVIRIAPMLNVSKDEIAQGLEILSSAAAETNKR